MVRGDGNCLEHAPAFAVGRAALSLRGRDDDPIDERGEDRAALIERHRHPGRAQLPSLAGVGVHGLGAVLTGHTTSCGV